MSGKTTITMEAFILIVLVHFIADFIFQAEKWSLGKSRNWVALLKHTVTYSIFWIPVTWTATGSLTDSVLFFIITFVAHTATDYVTSRIVSKRFADKYYGSPIPNFGAFTMVGFDQVLHYLQLILTWYWIIGV